MVVTVNRKGGDAPAYLIKGLLYIKTLFKVFQLIEGLRRFRSGIHGGANAGKANSKGSGVNLC